MENKPGERQGVIEGVSSSGSLLLIKIRRQDGKLETIQAENPSVVRAFKAAFGPEVVGPGHVFNVEVVIGKSIAYNTDAFGILAYITPAE